MDDGTEMDPIIITCIVNEYMYYFLYILITMGLKKANTQCHGKLIDLDIRGHVLREVKLKVARHWAVNPAAIPK